jgi:hypothetical protein
MTEVGLVAVVEHKRVAVAVVVNLFVEQEQEFYFENIIAHHH